MRRSRDEGDRIAFRLPKEMRLEAERLARLSGESSASEYYRRAVAELNERLRSRLESGDGEEDPGLVEIGGWGWGRRI